MFEKVKSYRISTVLAVILHVAVFILLFVSLKVAHLPVTADTQPAKIIHAVAVDPKQVQAEVKQIKAQAEAKRKADLAWQAHLQKLASQAKQERLQEEKKLANLVTQQKKLETAHQAKLEQLQKQKEAAQKKTLEAEATKNVELKKEQEQAQQLLEQQMNDEQKQIDAAHEKQIASEVDRYKMLILNAIGQHWIIPANASKDLTAELLVKVAPGGAVLSVSLLKSSGNAVLDRSAINAVWKSTPLPVPNETDIFGQFRELHLTVKPEGLLVG